MSAEAGLELTPGLALGLLPALDGLPPVLELSPPVAPEVPAAAPLDAPEAAPAAAPAPLLPDAPLPLPDPEPPLGPQARTTVVGASSNATASRNDKTVIVCFLIRSSLGRSSLRRNMNVSTATQQRQCHRAGCANAAGRPCGRRSGVA